MSKTLDEFRTLYNIESGNPESYLAAEHRIAYKNAEKKKAQDQLLASEALAADTAAANNALARTRVTYGQTAERLAQAGLTGSGYSDNITREAYALRQNAVSDARVKYNDSMRTAADTELATQYAADSKLATDLGKLDTQRDKDYLSLLESAKTGALSPKDISLVTEGKGFSEDQVKQLKSEAEKQFRSEMLTYLDSTDPNMDYQTVEWAEGQGYITPDELQAIQTNWRQITNTGASAFQDDDGNYISKEAAKAYIDRYAANPWHSEEGLAELRAAYANTYEPQTGVRDEQGKPDYKTKEGAVEYDRGKSTRGFGDEGDNFRLKVTDGKSKGNDKWFMVESGGQVIDDPRVASAAADVPEGVAFAYGGKVYIKDGGKVYLVRARGSNQKSYQELVDYLTKGKTFREPEVQEWTQTRDWSRPSAF